MPIDKNVSYSGHLYNGSQTKSRYLTPSSFALISDEVCYRACTSTMTFILINCQISSINELLRAQQRQSTHHVKESGVNPSRTCSASPIASSDGGNIMGGQQYGDIFPRAPTWSFFDYTPQSASSGNSTNELLSELPSREQSYLLIWSYMTGFHPMMPIVDIAAFFRGVQQLHDQ